MTPPKKRTAGPASARATIAQVAERAGVSRTAAGFVLSGRRDQRIAEDTWGRVERAAAELGYRPNQTARTLRTGTSGTIAMISDYISTTSLANAMIRGALRELRERDLLLFTVETLGDRAVEHKVVTNLLDRQVDGFIFATMFTREITLPAAAKGAPVVLLNCLPADGSAVSSVVPDELDAGVTAATVLLDAGHRDRVAFIGTLPPGMSGGAAWEGAAPVALRERLAGIRSVLGPAGVDLLTVDVDTDWDPLNGRAAMARLLAAGGSPSAVICANDALAIGAYQALREAGLSIPDEMSVVAFDDSPSAEWLLPPLTSIALPHEEMGRTAVKLLLDRPGEAMQVRQPMRLARRASVADRREAADPATSVPR